MRPLQRRMEIPAKRLRTFYVLSACGLYCILLPCCEWQVAYKLGFQVPESHLVPYQTGVRTHDTLDDVATAALRSGRMQQVRVLVQRAMPTAFAMCSACVATGRRPWAWICLVVHACPKMRLLVVRVPTRFQGRVYRQPGR